MKNVKKLLYSNMYEFEANGIALIALVTLIAYGVVSLIRDFISIFL